MAEKKVWSEEEIAEKIATDPKWLRRGILAIYKLQTADEQLSGDTRYNNNVGFSSAHSKFLSYVAQWLSEGEHRTVSPRFETKARRFMSHYVGQLTKIANGEIE